MDNYNELFYLIFQPIVEIKKDKSVDIVEYEVLLRSYENDRFPNQAFNDLLVVPEKHKLFMDWYAEKINDILIANETIYLAINIHPKQWEDPGIFDFFNKLNPFSNRIKIELTEHKDPMTYDICQRFESVYTELARFGYHFVIDDVRNGVNDIDFVIAHIEQISSIKFTILPFKKLKEETLLLFIDAWFQLAKDFDKDFIVEGIECQPFSSLLLDKGISLQQGFLFGEGKRDLVPTDGK